MPPPRGGRGKEQTEKPMGANSEHFASSQDSVNQKMSTGLSVMKVEMKGEI